MRDVFLFNARRWPFVGALLPGLVSAVLMLLAYPAFDVWWLVFLAPLPLVMVAAWTGGPWRSGLAATLTALIFWGWHERWVVDVSAAGVVPLVMYLALYPGLFVAITGRIVRRWRWVPLWIVAPAVWVGLEVLRGEVVWDGYAWYLLAHPTIAWLGLGSIASVVGTYVVSGVVVLPASVVVDGLRALAARKHVGAGARRAWWRIGLVATAALYLWAASPWSLDAMHRRHARAHADVLAEAGGETTGGDSRVRFAVVQTSVPQDNKVGWTIEQRLEDFAQFMAMTIQAAQTEPKPDVIVWPETMFPGYTLTPESVEEERRAQLGFRGTNLPTTIFYDRLLELQAQLGVPMIVGAIGADGHRVNVGPDGSIESVSTEREYNSAFVIAGGKVEPGRYDKIHLTPFGEVMPYISAWPWLERQLLDIGASGMSFSLSEGKPARLAVPVRGRGELLEVATPICFEVSSPGVVRRLVYEGVRRRAGVIVQLTNDGWFGPFKGGRAAHLQAARWRCVELATPLVRAANTGISAAVDASGRLVREYAVPLEPGAEVGPGPNPAGLMTVSVRPAPADQTTIYATLLRDRVAWGLGGVALVGFLGTFLGGRRTRGDGERTHSGASSDPVAGSEPGSSGAGVAAEKKEGRRARD